MYLPEAVESGKLFKRPKFNFWFSEIINACEIPDPHYEDADGIVGCIVSTGDNYKTMHWYISKNDALADDWIVKDEE